MIDKFYSPETDLSHLRHGPLGNHVDGFARLLASQGYSTTTARLKIRLMADFSAWLGRRHLSLQTLNEISVDEFLKTRGKRHLLRCGDSWTLNQLLHYLRQSVAIPELCPSVRDNPTERILRSYVRFLTDQRGVSQSTIDNYVPIAQRLLEKRFGVGKICLDKLRQTDVTDFITRDCSTGSPKRAQLAASALRSFLGFLTQNGKLRANLAASVPTVANWRLAGLPQFLEPAQVEELLSSCNQNIQVGRRDYAVLLLLARLGLRAGEVVHLNLEDINWAAGEVLIRGKSAREDRLPLLSEVGRALAVYLKSDRPTCSCRRVFIRTKAPHQGFSSSVAICNIFRRALTRVHLDPQQKGAHLLRRSLATKMLRRGATLTQIGEVLRHQRAQTTEIYAKVDLVALRALALPWPGGVR